MNTQEYGRRPYGVGSLAIRLVYTSSHLYEFSPSSTSFVYIAVPTGASSQSAQTYLEKHFETHLPFISLANLNMHMCRQFIRPDPPRVAHSSRVQQDKGLSDPLRILVLSLNQVGKAPVHQPEIFDLTASSLGKDGKSPQYEAPHGRVASDDCFYRERGEHALEHAPWNTPTRMSMR